MSGATGLAVTRALAHTGVECHAVHFDRAAPGLASRLARPHVSPDWCADPESFVSFLLSLVASDLKGAPASLFVADDTALAVVWEAREPLHAAGVRLAFSFAGPVDEALDKRTQIAAARRAGVDHPASEWGRAEELLLRLATFRYPVIVKPALSHVGVQRIGGKALRCASAAELTDALERTRELDVLVQEFVPGGDDQLYTCGAFRGGDQRLAFTGRKLKQHPPTLGISRLSEAVEIPEIVAGSLRLLEELGYEGVAQIEYKRDARDGVYRLMEVNARPWTWIGLATACGVNLPLAAHRWALQGDKEPTEEARGAATATRREDAAGREPVVLRQDDGRWIWLLAEAIHTAHDLAHGRWPRIAQWRGLRAEAFFARDDPGPLVVELTAVVRSRRARNAVLEAKRSLRRLQRRPAFALNLALALSGEASLRSAGRSKPPQGLPPGNRVLVLAPHPDDETIMCGASLAASRRRGDAVRIVALTAGSATTQGGLDDVAAARRSELRRAAATLGVVDVVFWDFPDRGLKAARDRVAALVAAQLAEFAPTDVYVPFPFDPHADHVASAMALADALASGTWDELTVHCGFVRTAPRAAWVNRVAPAAAVDWEAKLRAVAAYGSRDESVFVKPLQLARLAPGHLLRPVEQFVELSAPGFVSLAGSIEAGSLTASADEVRSHPLYVAREFALTRQRSGRISELLAEVT